MQQADQHQAAKKASGEAAAALIQEGFSVGLGTGSTAEYFIHALANRCQKGLKIKAVPSSNTSNQLAQSLKIPIADINSLTELDITVDGADQIDEKKRIIKGGGGALLREKIIASMSKEMVVIIDPTKQVKNLGGCTLPVEILPYGYKATIAHLIRLGLKGALRESESNTPFVTDNDNYIFDICLEKECKTPESLQSQILLIPGVIETGFFIGLAGRIIVGFNDGKINILP